MPAFLVVGYKNHELGIFSENDSRVQLIKKVIRKDLIRLIESDVDWFVFQGNLGFEAWCLEVAQELRSDYDIKLACIFPFADHGKNWNEANQIILKKFHEVDYINYSFETYASPAQLKQHQDFLLKNSLGCYLFYDSSQESRLSYFDKAIKELRDYDVLRLDFERLNEISQDWD